MPSIETKTKGLVRKQGLLSFYQDPANDRVLLEIPKPDPAGLAGQYLYVAGTTTGLGSNEIGIDRGQIGRTSVINLKRLANRVLIEVPNLRYRAPSGSAREQRSVEESFAPSIIWAGKVIAEDPDGKSLVDFSSFVARDAGDIQARTAEQGALTLDRERSVIVPDACLGFPENVEFEAMLTFASMKPGPELRATVPDPKAVTLVQHQSIVKLPDPGYKVRKFDPRSASGAMSYFDFSTPLSEPIEQKFMRRFRLERVDPTAARSKVKKPIVYYVDSAAPEPIRSALVDGARWWAQAFEDAGFIDAFKVDVLPEGVHPLDIRYNVIQWVHRSTRGWSYGNSVSDPRTGEIIKGHVSLESLRGRQDRLIFEGLLGTAKTGTGSPDDPVQLSLARIRQLSAHELGHTLGFAHNFAGSTYGGRASVMDYPAPLIKAKPDGTLDVGNAYGVGVGSWDTFTVALAYKEFSPGANEAAEMERLAQDAIKRKLLFLPDRDSRDPGGSHPLGVLWDNGPDPITGLADALAVRSVALKNFGERNIKPGTPLSEIEPVLVPVYLYHRYQVDAAVRMVGGLKYTFAVKGDGQAPTTPIDPARQREALDLLLQCVSPQILDLPNPILALLAPPAFGFDLSQENFPRLSSPVFDSMTAASTAADLVISGLLNPQRCARIVELHRRNSAMPSLDEVLAKIVAETFKAPSSSERHRELEEAVQWVVASRLMELATNEAAAQSVRAQATASLSAIRSIPVSSAFRKYVAGQIGRFLERPYAPVPQPKAPLAAPPGMPIGSGDFWGSCSGG